MPRGTVNAIIQQYKKTGQIKNGKRTGRPPKLTPRDERRLSRLILWNRRTPLMQILATFNPSNNVSISKGTFNKSYLQQRKYDQSGRQLLCLCVEQERATDWNFRAKTPIQSNQVSKLWYGGAPGTVSEHFLLWIAISMQRNIWIHSRRICDQLLHNIFLRVAKYFKMMGNRCIWLTSS